MLMKLNHIGIITKDLERTIEKFKGFGLSCTEISEGRKGIKAAFLPIGDTMIEFICHTEPDKGNDPLDSLVMGQKGVINHICFEVDDLEKSIADFERNGAKMVEGCPIPGAHGRIAFFYPETTEGILTELCEVK